MCKVGFSPTKGFWVKAIYLLLTFYQKREESQGLYINRDNKNGVGLKVMFCLGSQLKMVKVGFINNSDQTPAEVDKWTLSFGTVIYNPFIEA